MSALRSATKDKKHVAKMQKQEQVTTERSRDDLAGGSQSSSDYGWQSYYYSENSSSEFDVDDDDDDDLWHDDKSDHSWEPRDDLEEVLLNSLQNFKMASDRNVMYNRIDSCGRGQKTASCNIYKNGNTCPWCEQDVLPHQLGDMDRYFKEELSVLRQARLGTSR